MIAALKALADEKRLKIIEMLLGGNLCVGALAGHLGVSKPAASQHIQVLRKAGLVKGEKRGYWTHYSVDRQAVIKVAEKLNRLAAMEGHTALSCRRIIEISEKNQTREITMCENCCQHPKI
jgi:ArsR family transcriptional regulator, arsenate/arsenite/antimonite-responsive transcriptional repressor